MNKLVRNDDSPKIFEKCTYTWTLHEFSRICDDNKFGICLKSPKFPKTESQFKWQMHIFPNGQNRAKNYVSILLYQYNNPMITAKFLLRLKTLDEKILLEMNINECDFEHSVGRGYDYLLNTNKLKSELTGDVLKIHVVIWSELMKLKPNQAMDSLQESSSLTKLKRDFQLLFQNKELCDFLIKLKDSVEIPVHKNILAARSSVFSAMFKNETLENKVGYVEIQDIDKDTMSLLLTFIYTGSLCPDISEEAVKKLLPAADKYELLNLKHLCTENLIENIKVSNVVDILLLAEMYNCSELKNRAFAYILENLEEFYDEVKFQKVEKLFPNLLTKLLVKIINRITFQTETEFLCEK